MALKSEHDSRNLSTAAILILLALLATVVVLVLRSVGCGPQSPEEITDRLSAIRDIVARSSEVPVDLMIESRSLSQQLLIGLSESENHKEDLDAILAEALELQVSVNESLPVLSGQPAAAYAMVRMSPPLPLFIENEGATPIVELSASIDGRPLGAFEEIGAVKNDLHYVQQHRILTASLSNGTHRICMQATLKLFVRDKSDRTKAIVKHKWSTPVITRSINAVAQGLAETVNLVEPGVHERDLKKLVRASIEVLSVKDGLFELRISFPALGEPFCGTVSVSTADGIWQDSDQPVIAPAASAYVATLFIIVPDDVIQRAASDPRFRVELNPSREWAYRCDVPKAAGFRAVWRGLRAQGVVEQPVSKPGNPIPKRRGIRGFPRGQSVQPRTSIETQEPSHVELVK